MAAWNRVLAVQKDRFGTYLEGQHFEIWWWLPMGAREVGKNASSVFWTCTTGWCHSLREHQQRNRLFFLGGRGEAHEFHFGYWVGIYKLHEDTGHALLVHCVLHNVWYTVSTPQTFVCTCMHTSGVRTWNFLYMTWLILCVNLVGLWCPTLRSDASLDIAVKVLCRCDWHLRPVDSK